MNREIDGQMDGWIAGSVDGWMDEWTDGWMGGRMMCQVVLITIQQHCSLPLNLSSSLL